MLTTDVCARCPSGISGPEDVLKATRAELDAAFSTNVSGPMVITQTFLPLLKAAPQPKVRPRAVLYVAQGEAESRITAQGETEDRITGYSPR